MLTEMVEYGWKIEDKVKAMKREIKENAQGRNSDGKETRTEINNLEETEQNEETRIQKNEERLRNLRDNFKSSSIRIIGVPEEEEQKIENI